MLERKWRTFNSSSDYAAWLDCRFAKGSLKLHPRVGLSGAGRALASAYYEAGGVLDIRSYDWPPGPPPREQDLQRAILSTFARLSEERRGKFSRIISEDFRGRPCSYQEFLGWGYDHRNHCLALRGASSPYLNDYFIFPYEETEANIVQCADLASEWDPDCEREEAKGYAYAFSQPPYGLRLDSRETNLLFSALNQELFGEFGPELRLHAWDTHWCRYFEAGREWWGEFLWTIHRPATNYITIIAGSSTD